MATLFDITGSPLFESDGDLGQTLAEASKRGISLPGLYLGDAELIRLKARIIAPFARIWNVAFEACDLSDSDLSHAFFDHSVIHRSRLYWANLSHSLWDESDIRESHFNFSRLTGARFRNCEIIYNSFNGALVGGMKIKGCSKLFNSFRGVSYGH